MTRYSSRDSVTVESVHTSALFNLNPVELFYSISALVRGLMGVFSKAGCFTYFVIPVIKSNLREKGSDWAYSSGGM